MLPKVRLPQPKPLTVRSRRRCYFSEFAGGESVKCGWKLAPVRRHVSNSCLWCFLSCASFRFSAPSKGRVVTSTLAVFLYRCSGRATSIFEEGYFGLGVPSRRFRSRRPASLTSISAFRKGDFDIRDREQLTSQVRMTSSVRESAEV